MTGRRGSKVKFSPDGSYLAMAHQGSPYVIVYLRTGDVFLKMKDPSAVPDSLGRDVSFSPDGTYLSISHQSAPYITVLKI